MVDITYFECPFCNKKFTKRAFISKHLNIYNLPIIYSSDFMVLNKIKASDIWAKDARKLQKAIDNDHRCIVIWEDEITSKNDDELKLLIKMRLAENEYYFL